MVFFELMALGKSTLLRLVSLTNHFDSFYSDMQKVVEKIKKKGLLSVRQQKERTLIYRVESRMPDHQQKKKT